VFRQLQASRQMLSAEGATLVKDSTPQWLAAADCPPFDVVFLDPPFAGDLLQQTVDVIAQRPLLTPGALIYIEAAVGTAPRLPADWQPVREKHTGDVCYRLFSAAG
ncbi:MAG: RsmD family RNA methyltransferase, partial [Bacteroidales bacterium]|nr:RsmD family RNA methyltransferase [Bacteroidales bacterium]